MKPKNHIKILLFLLIASPVFVFAQSRKLSLNEAVRLGVENSKALKLSKEKLNAAANNYRQVLDEALPSSSVSAIYNHAEIPAHTLQLGPDPINLPQRADAYLGMFSLEQLIFAGNKMKYAKESADLLQKIAVLDSEKDADDVKMLVISSYINLYKLQTSKEVVKQNLESLDSQLKQTERFFEQGLVTKNDVLRLQLQRSNIELTNLELEKNRRVVNYNLNILLGLPEQTVLSAEDVQQDARQQGLETFLSAGLEKREELQQADFRIQVADKNIQSTKANTLPTLGAALGAYYVNAGGKFIPSSNEFITPITIGATLSWNIGSLWNNKNKVAAASISKEQSVIGKSMITDQLKQEINNNYQNYELAINKIEIIETSVEQAEENDRIVQSKYTNSVASITDRIDADTQLFQSKINLELAKADATLAYYNLLKSSGQLEL